MRRILLVLAIAVVVAIGVLAFALSRLNTYLNGNREWLASQAEARLHRSVHFGEIGISLAGGLGVRVKDLRIDDDPAFSKEPFVTAGAIDLRVALLPALVGKIAVDHVVLRSPAITVVQTARGMSTSTLGGATAKPAAKQEPPAEKAGLPAFTVRSVEVTDGTLRFVNRTATPPAETTVTKLDFTARNVSLTGPIPFELKAAMLGAPRQNVRITGQVTDLENPKADFTLASDELALARGAGAEPAGVVRGLTVAGTVSVPRTGPRVHASVRSDSGSFAGTDYGDLAVDLALENQIATIEKLSVALFGGTLGATGSYDMRSPNRPRFDLQTTLSSMRLEKIAESRSARAAKAMEGGLGGALTLTGSGTSWEQIRPGLTGHGNVVLTDGVLRDVNLADAALQGITGVPGLSNLLPPDLRQRYPQVFGVGDTVFENMDAKIDIRDGYANFRDFKLAARDYAVAGEGRYALDNRLDLATVMTFSQSLSDQLVKAAEPMAYLRSPEGRVAIPVRLVGPLPDIKPVPDVAYIAKAASRQAVGKLLDKALGVQPQKQEGEAQKPSAEGAASELLKKGLDGLLKK